ncbi:storkhead-box protein 1-like [Ara ararauna]
MPRRAERCLQIAPHSLAIVLGAAAGGRPGGGGGGAGPAAELSRHRIGYEIFADFKRENMQHFWDRRATAAVAETFFLGWIDEQVLLVQGKEEHLEVLRQGWARRSLKPPSGFHIKCLATGGSQKSSQEDSCVKTLPFLLRVAWGSHRVPVGRGKHLACGFRAVRACQRRIISSSDNLLQGPEK